MDSSETALVGGILIFVIIIALIAIICGIIMIVAKWKILEKGGEQGWKAIIPVYGDMVMCKIAGVWFWYPLVIFGISFITGMFSGASSEGSSAVGSIIELAGSVVSIYYTVILSFSLAKSFGKTNGFGVGLWLLGIVFYPMLGFGKSQYVGPLPINDPIMGSVAANSAPATPAAQAAPAQGKICPDCGNNNPADSAFCQKCGKQI